MFGLSRNSIWAFSVHLLTASGAFFAFLALVAAAENRFPEMFFWMAVSLFVDAIDGPLARKLEVKKWWPHFSGDMLDAVIDYFSYVMLPAFALYQSGLLGMYASFIAAAVIVVTSAIYYADTRMKSEDYGFVGFPVVWNMVVFGLFVLSPNEYFSIVVVLSCAVLTFTPMLFIHPMRVKVWRGPNFTASALWLVSGLVALYYKLDPPLLVDAVILLSSAYLFFVGLYLQLTGKLK